MENTVTLHGSYKLPPLYANQWCSLWENHTIHEKMERDGEINSLMTGGSIVHINVDSKVTKTLINFIIKLCFLILCIIL